MESRQYRMKIENSHHRQMEIADQKRPYHDDPVQAAGRLVLVGDPFYADLRILNKILIFLVGNLNKVLLSGIKIEIEKIKFSKYLKIASIYIQNYHLEYFTRY